MLAANGILLLLTSLLLALHWVHLAADFPNHSRWVDWSKFTDEGWYGDAAIRHFQIGHWYVWGDFNPAAALPVWPALEAVLFHFTGVSLVAARALTVCVFAGILICGWWLVARAEAEARPGPGGHLTASLAVLLLAANPFCFVFSRLAILEPLLVLLTLFALLGAQAVRVAPRETLTALLGRNAVPIVCLGILLPAMVLTKTTGLFLVPAIAWMLFSTCRYRVRPFAALAVPIASLGIAVWLGYFLLLVKPHFSADYRYLFSANAYTGITRANFFSVIAATYKDGSWFGTPLFAAVNACVVVALASIRRLRQYPLIPALLLWAFGYAAFLAYHDNLQPRYYLVVSIPFTLLVPVIFRDLVQPRLPAGLPSRAGFVAAVGLLAAILVPDALQTVSFVRHPEYTLVDTAHRLRAYIDQDRRERPHHNPLVLSISGSDLSLIAGIHSICDDFGTLELVDRVNLYKPGWYAAWNLIEDDKMDALTPAFRVTRVATFPAMDDPLRNVLVLYRLDLASEVVEANLGRRARQSRSRKGRQPSPGQLAN